MWGGIYAITKLVSNYGTQNKTYVFTSILTDATCVLEYLQLVDCSRPTSMVSVLGAQRRVQVFDPRGERAIDIWDGFDDRKGSDSGS